MAIGTPQDLGHNATTGATSLAVTTTNAVSNGDYVIVGHYSNANTNSTATITDSASNSYTRIYANLTAPIFELLVCPNAAAMASSSSISLTFNGPSGSHALSCMRVTGLVPALGAFDPNALSSTGTATSATNVNGLVIGSAVSELCLGWVVSASALGTYTPGGSWTQLGGSTTPRICIPCYQILTGPQTTLAWGPTWVNSVLYRSVFNAFKALPATSTSREAQLALMGLGA